MSGILYKATDSGKFSSIGNTQDNFLVDIILAIMTIDDNKGSSFDEIYSSYSERYSEKDFRRFLQALVLSGYIERIINEPTDFSSLGGSISMSELRKVIEFSKEKYGE